MDGGDGLDAGGLEVDESVAGLFGGVVTAHAGGTAIDAGGVGGREIPTDVFVSVQVDDRGEAFDEGSEAVVVEEYVFGFAGDAFGVGEGVVGGEDDFAAAVLLFGENGFEMLFVLRGKEAVGSKAERARQILADHGPGVVEILDATGGGGVDGTGGKKAFVELIANSAGG